MSEPLLASVTAKVMRADELMAYYNSLPDGVSSESRAEAQNIRAEARAECPHPRESWVYLRTREDFYDGDEDDIYECGVCGSIVEEYIPR